MPIRRRDLCVLAAVLALCPSSASSQGTAAEEPFAETIEVSVVNLDVFVTDKKGVPIAGLAREDFTVFEDGRPVEITNFYSEGPAPHAAPGGGTPRAAARPPEQQLRLVVFVDDVNTEPRNRSVILDRLTGFLRRELKPGDEVMVVRYAKSLDIRQPFTADPATTEATVAAIQRLSADLDGRELSRDTLWEQIFETMEAVGGWNEAIEGQFRIYADHEERVLVGALNALDAVVGWLGGVAGRKAILYVSDGLPLAPGDDVFQWASFRSPYRAGQRMSALSGQPYDATERFRKVTARASRNRVAIYPIEVGGTRTVRGTMLQEIIVTNRQNGLRFLADDTGGRAMLNAADPGAALELLAEDLSTHYSLGYRPQRSGDEVEHKVEVQVAAKGAQVRHRRWYQDKPLSETIAERTAAVMRFGPEDNPLAAVLEIGQQTPDDGGLLVPLRVRIPLAKLYLVPTATGKAARLRLFVVASGGGTTTPVKVTRTLTVDVPAAEVEQAARREYVHDVGMTLQPGAWAVGVGIRDEEGATVAYLRKELTVAAGPAR
jgi:VWFA-related protein